MSPAGAVFTAWLLFGGTHLLLSWPPVRLALAPRIGEQKFTALYAVIATLSLLLLAVTIAHFGGEGPRGFDLASNAIVKWSLGSIAFFGAALAAVGIAGYPQSAVAVLARKLRSTGDTTQATSLRPTAIERLTRHPFFVGLALLMTAHTLLARTLPAALFFFGFACLALLGLPMQDRKLRDRHGKTYSSFVQSTSAVPFMAPKGRLREGWRQSSKPILLAIAGGTILALLHPLWTHFHGAWFAVLVASGGLYATIKQLRRRDNS